MSCFNINEIPPKLKSPTESQLTKAYLEWCEKKKYIAIHIPNSGKRFWALDKSRGIRSGMPDIFIPKVKMPYGGLFLEFKRDGASRISPQQIEWIQNLNKIGYVATVAIGLDEAMSFTDDYHKFSPDTQRWSTFLQRLRRCSY